MPSVVPSRRSCVHQKKRYWSCAAAEEEQDEAVMVHRAMATLASGRAAGAALRLGGMRGMATAGGVAAASASAGAGASGGLGVADTLLKVMGKELPPDARIIEASAYPFTLSAHSGLAPGAPSH